MKQDILHRIFFDEHKHWEAFVTKHGTKIRPVVLKEVMKFRDCGNPKKGFKLMACKGSHDLKMVLYRCKGRFCTTCSCGETEEWSRMLTEDVFQVNHRHVILTIDERLRELFLKHREWLKPFMDEGVRLSRNTSKRNTK